MEPELRHGRRRPRPFVGLGGQSAATGGWLLGKLGLVHRDDKLEPLFAGGFRIRPGPYSHLAVTAASATALTALPTLRADYELIGERAAFNATLELTLDEDNRLQPALFLQSIPHHGRLPLAAGRGRARIGQNHHLRSVHVLQPSAGRPADRRRDSGIFQGPARPRPAFSVESTPGRLIQCRKQHTRPSLRPAGPSSLPTSHPSSAPLQPHPDHRVSPGGNAVDLLERLREHRRQEEHLAWQGTFAEVYELVKANPPHRRAHAHARMYDMIVSHGVEEAGGVRRYPLFRAGALRPRPGPGAAGRGVPPPGRATARRPQADLAPHGTGRRR